MGTNLLLEGDDLEALLIRAHAEGGVNARIIRAEKVRQGGFMGFFARERFEVAVEIPDGAGAPDAALTSAGAAPVAGARTRQESAMTGPTQPTGQQPTGQQPTSTAIEDALVAELSRLLAADQVAAPAQVPAPAQAATDGLLGLADRVSSAELAAAQAAARATSRTLVGAGAPLTSGYPSDPGLRSDAELRLSVGAGIGADQPRLVLPDGRIVSGAPTFPGSGVLSAASAARGLPVASAQPPAHPATTPATGAAQAAPAAPSGASASHADPGTVTTNPGGWAAATGASRPAGRGGPADGADLPGWAVPPEPATSPVRPSTSRPEFTALLDQLRAGTLPPRPRAAADLLLGQPGGTHPGHPGEPGADPSTMQARAQRAYAPTQGGPDGRPGMPAAPASATTPAAPIHPAAPAYQQVPPAEAYPPALADRTRATLADRSHGGDRAHGGDRGQHAGQAAEQAADRRALEQRLTSDRHTLRALGIPSAWTRRMRGGDRFAAVLRMLERMPDVDIDPDVEVVALVGPRGVVQLEAHRTALDLPLEDRPRPVVVVPRDRRSRGSAIAKANKLGTVVVAIETEGYECDESDLETLQALGAAAVIAVVDADRPTDQSQRWLDALGQVDAIAVDNATAVADPASVLQLGLPVVRLDGIPVDRVTWSALLCAQLEAADPAH